MPIAYSPAPDTDLLGRLGACADACPPAYAPYSGYSVVAVVESIDGGLYAGMNVESAAYTPTQHAEETAVTAALLSGVRERCGQQWLARVYVRSASVGAPCGHCRQVLVEWASADCEWIGHDRRDGSVRVAALSELLPLAFSPAALAAGRAHPC